MLRSLLVMTACSGVLIPLVGLNHGPAIAQERQGCFMVDDTGTLIDLGYICPTAEQVAEGDSELTLGTGDIQVTLRWTSTDDLDLAVTDPSGQVVTYFNPNIPSGGQLDVDANAACSGDGSSPIENIFWPPSRAPQGNYSVEVNLFTRCGGGSGPIPFTLTLLVQGNTETLQGTVDNQTQRVSFPFSLPR